MDGQMLRAGWVRFGFLTLAFLFTSASCNQQSATPANRGENSKPVPDIDKVVKEKQTPAAPVSESPAATASEKPSSETTANSATVGGKDKGEGKDSAKEDEKHHEPLFVDWPKPQFVLLITGQQMGYIEPCGCTGLVNQKGGLARRHTLAKQLAERGWPVVPIDVGNQIRRFGPQSVAKFQVTSESLRKIGYRAIALGADDLRLSTGDLAGAVASSGDQPTPFVSANAVVIDPSFTPTHQIIEAGGKRIGVTSVISDSWQKKITSGEIILKPAEQGIEEVLPKLRDAKCDLMVLLAQATVDESQKFAQKYKQFQVVVTAGGLGEPTFQPETVPESGAVLVQVGLKGMFVGVLGFFDDPKKPWRYQRVPLDSRFEDSPDMLAALASYQEQLKAAGLQGLGLNPVPHPSGRSFVGSEKCGECHTKAFAKWKETGHSHATDSLVNPKERSGIPRHFDPECLSCHVTGWEPQQFFPFASGYLDLEKSKLLHGSGCENCHGPGSKHVAAEEDSEKSSEAQRKTLRDGMRLPLAKAEQKCKECHDLDNSPDFHATGAFEKYWKEIEHPGLD